MHTAIQNYTVENIGSSLKFSSPYRKSWFMILSLSGGVIVAGVILLSSVLRALAPEFANLPMLPPLPFLAFLVLLGGLTLIELLWQLWGLEVAEVTESQITIKHQIFGVGLSKNLQAQRIDGVFISKQRNNWSSDVSREFKILNFKKGAVAINYGKTVLGEPRTYRFGSILDREDAEQIVELIYERFPQYKYSKGRKAG